MKNKFIKAIFVLFLCLIIFAGCSAVPSLTPDVTPTPTPIEPTPTPIPYGEVLDITVAYIEGSVKKTEISEGMKKILLEKFSLNITDYVLYEEGIEADLIFVSPTLDMSFNVDDAKSCAEWLAKNRLNGINYSEYFYKMPNYTSLFYDWENFYKNFNEESAYILSATGLIPYGTTFWLYNEVWFSENGYSIPNNINELVDILVEYKKNNPNAKPIFLPREGEAGTRLEKYDSLAKAVFAAYGLDFSTSYLYNVIDVNGNDFNFTMDDPKVIQALNTVKRIIDNDLVGDVDDEYYDSGYLNYNTDIPLNDFAVTYAGYGYSVNLTELFRYIMSNGENWGAFSNQLSVDEVHPYLNSTFGSYAEDAYAPATVVITDTEREEVKNRLIDYIDWCCTDEGIIAETFGIEGEDYIFESETSIKLLKDIENIKPASIDMVSREYKYSVLSKYIELISFRNDYLTVLFDFIQKNFGDTTPIFFENISVLYEFSHDVSVSHLMQQVVKNFCVEYLNGTKTADDFNDYLEELESSGVNATIEETRNAYNSLYDKCKDYLPDSLK